MGLICIRRLFRECVVPSKFGHKVVFAFSFTFFYKLLYKLFRSNTDNKVNQEQKEEIGRLLITTALNTVHVQKKSVGNEEQDNELSHRCNTKDND